MDVLRLARRAGLSLTCLLALMAASGCVQVEPDGQQPTTTASSSSAPSPSPTDPAVDTALTVELYADGTNLSSQYTLSCRGAEPVDSSTVPDAAAACALIEENSAVLAPQRPASQPCTEQYGGPDRAVVTGTHRGDAVETSFTRSNGCAIAEWDALAPLLGHGGL
ncbi:serine protease inhibitor [Glutamicibacter creatinolyticus]|uniref:serine protease inhibitor n=1 Tax=Glutamicibacter creatinolyticus TaxID=162496 RepID=UPI0037BECA6B